MSLPPFVEVMKLYRNESGRLCDAVAYDSAGVALARIPVTSVSYNQDAAGYGIATFSMCAKRVELAPMGETP